MCLFDRIWGYCLCYLVFPTQMAFRRHHDADIPDHKMQHFHHRFTGDDSNSMSSSESSESQSSEEGGFSSEESSKVTTPVTTSTATTPVEEGSTLPPEVSTMGTEQPIVMKTTPPPATPTPSVNATPTCDQCFTVLIPTAAPITDNRGDNWATVRQREPYSLLFYKFFCLYLKMALKKEVLVHSFDWYQIITIKTLLCMLQ